MMYYRMNEKECELLSRLFEDLSLTTDYKLHGEFIPVESLMSVIQDLYYEIERLNEQLEDKNN